MLTSAAPRLSATTLDRLLLTPHLGYVTEKTWQLFYGDTLEAIEAFAAGAPIRTLWVIQDVCSVRLRITSVLLPTHKHHSSFLNRTDFTWCRFE